jgi:NADPH:quinone reductase-like Zn-dependent oxidoreductase
MLSLPDAIAGGSAAHAQKITLPADQVGCNSEGIDHEHASGAPMLLLTAWRLLIEYLLPVPCCLVRAAFIGSYLCPAALTCNNTTEVNVAMIRDFH